MQRTPLLLGALVALPALLAGCEGEDIRTYTVPADPPRLTTPVPSGSEGPGSPDSPAGEITLAWDVPEGWRPAKEPPGFVLAAYDAGPEDAPVLATVSRLAGAGGGAVANINRWRQQIGLPAISDLPEQPMERIDTASGEAAGMVDLVGEAGADGQPARTLAAILPRQSPDETWFFKLTGPRDRVEAQKAAFVALVASARVKGK